MVRAVLAVLSRPFDEMSSPFKESTVTMGDLETYLTTIRAVIENELESRKTLDGFPSVLFEKDRSMFLRKFGALTIAVPVSQGISLSNFNVARLALINRICEVPEDESVDGISRCFALCFALHYFVLLMNELLIEAEKKTTYSLVKSLIIDCSISHLRRMEITQKRKREQE